MSYLSLAIGFGLLVLALSVTYAVAAHILEQRGSMLYSMIELYVGLLIGIIYSVIVVCTSTNWAYAVRVAAGLTLGIVVGWALMMTVQLLIMLVTRVVTWIIESSRKFRANRR